MLAFFLIVFAFVFTNSFVETTANTLNDFNNVTLLYLDALQKNTNDYIYSEIHKLNTNASKSLVLAPKQINQILQQNQLNALYVDANMIHFLHSILPLSDYNNKEFYLLLKGTNNILKIIVTF